MFVWVGLGLFAWILFLGVMVLLDRFREGEDDGIEGGMDVFGGGSGF